MLLFKECSTNRITQEEMKQEEFRENQKSTEPRGRIQQAKDSSAIFNEWVLIKALKGTS